MEVGTPFDVEDVLYDNYHDVVCLVSGLCPASSLESIDT